MTAEQQGAIISDGFLTALVRAATWETARPELRRQRESYAAEMEGDKPDAFDRMCIDLCYVWLLHSTRLGAPRTLPRCRRRWM